MEAGDRSGGRGTTEVGAGRATALWISWSGHRRTSGLCDAWNVPLTVLQARRTGPLRWFQLAVDTLAVLRERRPALLFVQCPSIALTSLATLCRHFFGYFLVVDAHNEAVRPFDRPYAAVRWLSRRLLRSADTTIVSNDALGEDVSRAGGRPLVLPDRLPAIPAGIAGMIGQGEQPDVAVVATYRPDEPIDAIVAAAATLPDLAFAFTGPIERFAALGTDLPDNVRPTGFLDDRDYWALLERSRVVCDLTLKSDCLVCGAYEALALGKAMVLSDNPPTRAIFGDAAKLTDASPGDIAEAIRDAVDQQEHLEAGARSVRERYPAHWQKQADRVAQSIRSRFRVEIGKSA